MIILLQSYASGKYVEISSFSDTYLKYDTFHWFALFTQVNWWFFLFFVIIKVSKFMIFCTVLKENYKYSSDHNTGTLLSKIRQVSFKNEIAWHRFKKSPNIPILIFGQQKLSDKFFWDIMHLLILVVGVEGRSRRILDAKRRSWKIMKI